MPSKSKIDEVNSDERLTMSYSFYSIYSIYLSYER